MSLSAILQRIASRSAFAMLSLSLAAWAGLAAGLATGPAQAQARATADRSFGLAAYAGGSYARTDYGSNDKGYIVGADLNTIFHHFQPALDARYTSVTGTTANQSSFAGGLKLQRKFGPFRPYGDMEVGFGTIGFVDPGRNPDGSWYRRDNSVITAFGGGVDVRVARWIDVKADAQYQLWKLGHDQHYLTPFITSIGVVYRIPYRPLSSF
jgi:hypothetical protein